MDFVSTRDIARANVLAAESDVTDEVFNIASGVETSLRELAATLLRVMGSDLPVEYGPERKVNDVSRRLADTAAARDALGFEAEQDLEEGLRRARRLVVRAPRRRPLRAGRAHAGGDEVMQVPFAKPRFYGGEAEALAAVIESGWVSQGPRVQAFEDAFAARVGAADAVATTNCTTALQLALYASGVGPGDEVIVPVAVVHRHRQRGLAVRRDAGLRRRRPADLQPRPGRGRAGDHAAHEGDHAGPPDRPAGRHGRVPRARRARTAWRSSRTPRAPSARPTRAARSARSGPLACFSLHPRKVITTGEGGMITTNDAALADRMRKLRQHAMDLSDLARHNAADIVFESYPERGWNMRMTDLQAALGLCQLEALDEILAERTRQAERYNAALASLPGLETPFEPDYAVRTWQSYAVRVSPSSPVGRTDLMRRLHRDGVATRRGIMAIHHEDAYEGRDLLLPHTDAAARDVLLLPLFPGLGDDAAGPRDRPARRPPRRAGRLTRDASPEHGSRQRRRPHRDRRPRRARVAASPRSPAGRSTSSSRRCCSCSCSPLLLVIAVGRSASTRPAG